MNFQKMLLKYFYQKQRNKQRKKQTNKKNPKYLCQIKPDLHETFRETSCGCQTMNKTQNKQIHIQKNKQINIF